jgi:hypothetical protein
MVFKTIIVIIVKQLFFPTFVDCHVRFFNSKNIICRAVVLFSHAISGAQTYIFD